MSNSGVVHKDEKIVLYHEKFGFVRAFAGEDFEFSMGTTAVFQVIVNSNSMPGVDAISINVNHWEVFHEDDPDLAKKLLQKFVPHYVTR